MADAPAKVSDDEKRELQEAASGGIGKMKEYIKKKNNEWKKIPLNIAITGGSGVGKSSFINAIRGITADDEGGAHVDVVEATKEVKSYAHPKHESMILWDLPGVGTPNFPRDKYLKQVEFKEFDFFLILSASRFRDDDLWLAKEINKLNKKFHFVRTHIDNDVSNDKKAHPKTHEKGKVMEKVRNDCIKNLEEHGLTKASVFLINNYAQLDFDFNGLTTTLIEEVPVQKKEAMTLSLSVLTKGVIEKKVNALEKRIFKISLYSAAAGAIPIPGLGAAVDVAVLLEEVLFYKIQFGLDSSSMEENARLLKTETTALVEKLGLKSFGTPQITSDLIQEFLQHAAVKQTLKSTLPVAIPFIGCIVSAGIAYGLSVWSLEYFLNMCASDAKKIHEELLKHYLE